MTPASRACPALDDPERHSMRGEMRHRWVKRVDRTLSEAYLEGLSDTVLQDLAYALRRDSGRFARADYRAAASVLRKVARRVEKVLSTRNAYIGGGG